MNRITLLLATLVAGLLVGCSGGTGSSACDAEPQSTESKKEALRYYMSGIWSNRYNPYLELDLAQDSPYLKNSYGNTSYLEIVSYDLENLTVIVKTTGINGKVELVTLRLNQLENGGYALSWKYERGQVMLFSFVRKLDRFLQQ